MGFLQSSLRTVNNFHHKLESIDILPVYSQAARSHKYSLTDMHPLPTQSQKRKTKPELHQK